MPTTYTAVVQEKEKDLTYFQKNGYRAALAKSVASSGETIFNTIYSGMGIGPMLSVSWTETYALNYRLNIPNPGAKVDVSGLWQRCDIGDGYILNEIGEWELGTGAWIRPGCLNVMNSYNSDTCIVVGIQDTNGNFRPIFFDPDALVEQGTGHYEPQETVQIWWGSHTDTGSVISQQESAIEEYTMQPEQSHYFWLDTDAGKWYDSDKPFPPGDHPEVGTPILRTIKFSITFKNSGQFTVDFVQFMSNKGWFATITAKTPGGAEYSAYLQKKDNDSEGWSNPDGDINYALVECKKKGDLPSKETWTITP